MRIGELAERVGVSTDTLRFYEKAGWLPRPTRSDNGYRRYREADIEHLRLLIDLRRLELPLDEAAQLAGWCHSGHCGEMTATLSERLVAKRTDIAERIERLRALDDRLADLAHHVSETRTEAVVVTGRRGLTVIGGPTACCDAASAVASVIDGACACCGPTAGPRDD